MILNVQQHDGIDIVDLSGRFVMADTAETRERMLAIINQGSGKLIIDLQNVTFIDSSACAVLISAFKNIHAKSGRLILVTSPVVQSVLELTRLHTIFEILPSIPAAIGAFGAK